MICNDGFSVSFQPFLRDAEALLHHHPHAPTTRETTSTKKSMANGHYHSGSSNSSRLTNGGIALTAQQHPRPIEFRRKVIIKPERTSPVAAAVEGDPASPMTKLLKEEQKRSEPRMIASVEVHPVKLLYSLVNNGPTTPTTKNGANGGGEQNKNIPNRGMVLVSQRVSAYDALQALLKVAAPGTSSSCKRVWTRRENGTSKGDGFELTHLDGLDGRLQKKENEGEIPQMLVGEWLRTHGEDQAVLEFEVLVETKPPNEPWPRAPLELENRIQVGDFVDAQDATGHWYESLVREVTEDSVTVHFFGWASKWDFKIRRRREGDVPLGLSLVSATHAALVLFCIGAPSRGVSFLCVSCTMLYVYRRSILQLHFIRIPVGGAKFSRKERYLRFETRRPVQIGQSGTREKYEDSARKMRKFIRL